ncbi:hypothetical protein WG66_005197 [Moniliophthora roreri]|uniref:F-box domain-containing protein n=1 Tax=Moniliophthora roreri TaxID=221103 RepID=A0A0W0F3Q6_MONRR|nr:hypothetical protein WG66_005197 [Moniliophthora roreri]
MSPPLPPELIEFILSYLRDIPGTSKADINHCALVCRAWMPKARSLVFNTLSLRPGSSKTTVQQFLRLCESPLQTLSVAGIKTFAVCQDPKETSDRADFYLDNLLTWCSSDGKRTIQTVLPSLKRLSLSCIAWWTVSDDAKRALHEGFNTVAELELYQVHFDSYHEFTDLLHAIPLLHSIDITGCRGSTCSNLVPCRRPLENLRQVTIRCPQDAKLLHALVPSPNLRVFRCHQPSYASDVNGEMFEAIAINLLLNSATTSLEEIVFEAGYFANWQLGVLERYLDGLDLTKHPNLRVIDLTVMTPQLIDVLERIANSSTHHKSRLEVLRLPHLTSINNLDWSRLDGVLQHPYFSGLTELTCNLCCIFSQDDVVGQPWCSSYSVPDINSDAAKTLQTRLLQLGMYLPMCEQRGILVPHVDYWYASRCLLDVYIPPLPVRRTRREKIIAALQKAIRFLKGR